MANDVIRIIKERYQLPVVCLQTSPILRVKADKVVLDASPEAFVGWIKKANYVITTSFHGTAFSIIFEKSFVSLTKEGSNPVRLKTLLSSLGCQDRIIYDLKALDNLKHIDWNMIRNLLDEQRKNSINYLKSISDSIN